jgi:hypothetical protein
MALNTLNRYLFRFTIQTRCEQSSQCQRSLVRLPSLSVLGYLNFTLASNQNNNAAASVNQGGNGINSASQPVNLFASVVTDGQGQLDTVATTQFVSDSNVVSATKALAIDIDPSFINSSTDLLSQEVRDFLMKPVILAAGNFTTTDTYSTFPEFLSPNDILGSNNSMMGEKLRGYLGFRATTVLRLVVNATRFQQGRYNVQFVPTGGAIVGATGNPRARVSAITSTLVQRIQLPHVEIDLNCDTEAILKYKFNSAYGFFPMTSFTSATSAFSFGLFKIYPYSPLVAGSGSLTCGYTLWASFEDVELISAAVPQSGRVFTSVKSKNETDTEQVTSGMGPISSALMRVKGAADVFTRVPLLSSYASMTSWYSEILAGAASAFGWSRPINLEHSNRVTQNYLPYAANTDGPDNSFPLSYSYKNQVGKAQGFSGTDIDEMDFSFLCTIPTFNSIIPWTTAQASGLALVNISVRPLGLLVTRTVTAVGISDIGPYQFISNLFEQWRGSMVYKFKLVKTEFHSGRLAVSFSPCSHDGTAIVPTLAQTAFLHRQIIDIRECNEFTFVVPFISTSPYKKSNDIIGTFVIHILDPLIAPDTVSSSVGLILEHCMGADAEFAVPKKNNMQFVMGIAPQSGDPFSNNEPNVCANYRGNIGSSLVPPDECSNSLFCVGERISSLRTLFKIPNPLVYQVAPVASNYFNAIPYAIPFRYYSLSPAYLESIVYPDIYALVSSLYLYVRGGVRLKFLDNTSVTGAEPFATYLGSGINGPQIAGFAFAAVDGSSDSSTINRNGLPSHYYKAGFSGEVQVPAYGRYHSRLITDCMANAGNDPYNLAINSTAPSVFVSRTTVPSVPTLTGLLRSASDDANCGVFLAVPPVSGIVS